MKSVKYVNIREYNDFKTSENTAAPVLMIASHFYEINSVQTANRPI